MMQRAGHASAIIALVRDAQGGRVTVRRDGTAVVDYVPGKAEQKRIARGIETIVRLHLAAGAREVHTLHTRGMSLLVDGSSAADRSAIDRFCAAVLAAPVDRNRSLIASAHQMGTCRMGRDAKTAVCDEHGEVFGVKNLFVADASAFPASSGVNPMITVMALASCIADAVSASG
jgi:choline dehydrogenase-like flavoprotein